MYSSDFNVVKDKFINNGIRNTNNLVEPIRKTDYEKGAASARFVFPSRGFNLSKDPVFSVLKY